MSCSEVMYQAYYPYLYQRTGTTPAHPVSRAGPFTSPFSSAHQYDRFNVQRLQDSSSHASSTINTSSSATSGGRAQDRINASSNATVSTASGPDVSISYSTCNSSSSPSSPRSHSLPSATASISLQPPTSAPTDRQKEDSNICTHGDGSCCSEEGGESPGLNDCPVPGEDVAGEISITGGNSRAQYISANCVVFTHYQGEAAAIVDEHFSKALDKGHNKEASPMSARNFPASFWNSAHQYGTSNNISGISTCTSDGLYHQSEGTYLPSDWYHQYSQYHHHHHHQHHHHSMAAAASYSGLLLSPPGSRLHMSAAAAGAAAAAQCKAMDWQHAAAAVTLDNPYSSYPNMSGLEAQVQESSKDLYWF